MAVAFRSNSLNNNIATTINGGEPAGAAQDDILIAQFYSEDTTAITVTPPTGWNSTFTSGAVTIKAKTTTGGVFTRQLFWIRRGATAPAYGFSTNGTNSFEEVVISAYSGAVNTGDPFSFATGAIRDDAAALTFPSTSGTTLAANEMAVWFGANQIGTSTFTAPTSFTGRQITTGMDDYSADFVQTTAGLVTASGALWTGTAGSATSALVGLSSVTPSGGTYVAPVIVNYPQAVNRASRY